MLYLRSRVFFFKQKTAYEMRISDWSSDVCSSDLASTMAEFFDALTDKHIAFIEAQPVFFTATAAAEGRINLSPKGYADSFKILSERRVAYLDLGGSGNETHAHLAADRSEERRVGEECVSTCRSRWSPYH